MKQISGVVLAMFLILFGSIIVLDIGIFIGGKSTCYFFPKGMMCKAFTETQNDAAK